MRGALHLWIHTDCVDFFKENIIIRYIKYQFRWLVIIVILNLYGAEAEPGLRFCPFKYIGIVMPVVQFCFKTWCMLEVDEQLSICIFNTDIAIKRACVFSC